MPSSLGKWRKALARGGFATAESQTGVPLMGPAPSGARSRYLVATRGGKKVSVGLHEFENASEAIDAVAAMQPGLSPPTEARVSFAIGSVLVVVSGNPKDSESVESASRALRSVG